jgi:hemerythrin-like domain-containing protein
LLTFSPEVRVARSENRRAFLSTAAFTGAGVMLVGLNARAKAEPPKDAGTTKPADVNATEDLMREHGVLRRVLLIYAEAVRRINASTPPPADTVTAAAKIIQSFIEGYHEKLEEEEVFPRMVKAGQAIDLVAVLVAQHQAGRRLTTQILQGTTTTVLNDRARSQPVVHAMQQFIRMYEPHAAREDTVLFPAFHDLFTEAEFDRLGDQFEEKEHQVLGERGFEGTVKQVAQIEKTLGIYDLAQFTAK